VGEVPETLGPRSRDLHGKVVFVGSSEESRGGLVEDGLGLPAADAPRAQRDERGVQQQGGVQQHGGVQ